MGIFQELVRSEEIVIHKMGLFEIPFNSIKLGRKIVEVRLYDEKRRKLNIGDKIEFVQIHDKNDAVTVKVTGLRNYNTFKEMYEDIPPRDLDTVGESVEEMVENTYKIYTPEKEKEWGTLAISVKLEA
ncbi:ASCH domain-containing protein [Virgibacillus salexigens]|uniref:ASCH domain-containing protein n=1 Tax=Virgibacillus kapii TaxID=1638645 RepID=UPI0035A2280A